MTAPARYILVVAHTGREESLTAGVQVCEQLIAAGASPVLSDDEQRAMLAARPSLGELAVLGVDVQLDELELVIVLGGDGTILRAAELVRGCAAPLLGVNLGHVGFLAESERDNLSEAVARVLARDYEVEERMTLSVRVKVDDKVVYESWALNEATVEKASRERMLEVVIEVDGRPLSSFGCDGVVMSTPTGSTAYAFSAGGPIVWPGLAALLLVPLSAHALFARPLVVDADSSLAVEVLARAGGEGILWCDGRRAEELPPGARVVVRRSPVPVKLARLHSGPFTDRLVQKFDLPVTDGGARWAVIEEISIRDLGVIADASLPLGPGFTALTGETGAGKTMVVSALGLLLGERADAGAVRSGSAQASVEGRWRVAAAGDVAERVRDAGGDLDEAIGDTAELVLSRSVSSEGRSRAIVGGRSAPVSVLSELGEQLVVVHGQSDQVRLRSAVAQRDALDRFAGPVLAAALDEYARVFQRWRDNRVTLEQLVSEQARRVQEAEELRTTLAEIESVAPVPGEDAELAERAERLTNLEDLRTAAAGAREIVSAEESDDPDAVTLLDTARRLVERAGAHDARLAEIADSLTNASYLVADVAAQLSSYLAGLDEDGARELELVQERRSQLATLVRKYGPAMEDVIELLDTGSARLLELDGDSERVDELRASVDSDGELVSELASALTVLRREAAERLGAAVSNELTALAMADAKVIVEVSEREEFGLSGRDQVTFLLKPHSGTEPRPLGRGASGGELSRVMLAIEVVIAGSEPVPTFIFDEIDAGVGGASAIEIGRRLAVLAQSAQVIVVTHLAQVAAFATNHLSVVKGSDGSVTASSVRQLVGDERISEMARLLSGLPDSESGLAHARELVELASSLKAPARDDRIKARGR